MADRLTPTDLLSPTPVSKTALRVSLKSSPAKVVFHFVSNFVFHFHCRRPSLRIGRARYAAR
jgi:hypothetical protein